MAITLITVPPDYGAIYNPIILTASSTKTAEANFKFVIDIEFNYPSGITTKRIKMSPRPDGFLLFDSHRIVENYLSFNFGIGDATDAIACTESWVDFVLHIGEEYGTTPVVYPNLDSTGDLVYNNSALKHSVASFGTEPNRIDFDLYSDYAYNNGVTGTTKKFLTSSPRTITICADKNYYLYFLIKTEPIKLQVKTYDSGGSLLGTANKTLTVDAINILFRIGVGTKNINTWNAAILIGASSYTVQLTNNAGTAVGELFTFNIDCDCSKFNEHFRLHWLNPLGGFDAFSFNMKFERNFNSLKSSFKKILGAVDGAGAFTFAPSQAGKVQFNVLTTEKIKVNSNWITETESNWLFTLAKSTQVFWEIDSSTYAPVIITNTSYQQKTYAGNHLFNIDFEIEIGNDIISQRQ